MVKIIVQLIKLQEIKIIYSTENDESILFSALVWCSGSVQFGARGEVSARGTVTQLLGKAGQRVFVGARCAGPRAW